MNDVPKDLVVGVVGPCGAGKTTLVAKLAKDGWNARHIAQEHSFVADMWRRISHPDLLVFLDVSYATSLKRRPSDWSEADYAEQQRRLAHARQNADLYIFTDDLTPAEVYQKVQELISLGR